MSLIKITGLGKVYILVIYHQFFFVVKLAVSVIINKVRFDLCNARVTLDEHA